VTKEIKANTGIIRDNTDAIKQDTTLILEEIARLKAQLPDSDATLVPNVRQTDARLAGYLDDLTSYAGTLCWSGEDSDTEADTSIGEATPLGTPVLRSHPDVHVPDAVPVFRDLIQDPILTPIAQGASPGSQREPRTVLPPNPRPGGVSSVPVASKRKSLSKDRITQRVLEKLQAQTEVEVDTEASLKQYWQSKPRESVRVSSDVPAIPREPRLKNKRAGLLGTRRQPETARRPSERKIRDVPHSDGDRHAAHSIVPNIPEKAPLNNPKLLATVEDAIRRLILPELNQMKADEARRRRETSVSKRARKALSRDSDSANHQIKSNEAFQKIADAALTAAALEQHTSREERRERRKLRERRGLPQKKEPNTTNIS
jgi:hypothetical protein